MINGHAVTKHDHQQIHHQHQALSVSEPRRTMSNSILSAQAVSANGLHTNGAATVTPLPVGLGARSAVVMERKVAHHAPRRSEAPMFLDTAHTVLPIEFQGKEIMLEAHAYEDESVSYQAMALVHRQEGAKPRRAARARPLRLRDRRHLPFAALRLLPAAAEGAGAGRPPAHTASSSICRITRAAASASSTR